MTRNELIIEYAERLARHAAESMKACDRAIAILDRKPLSVEDELKKFDATFFIGWRG